MLKKLLIPFSWIYYCITSIRNFLYDNQVLKSHEFDVPVISIGNITVGGTGKTPHTECIVDMLKENFNITILSRGYKRKTHGYIKANNNSTVAEIGDEPKQMARKFCGKASVAVCEDRAIGIQEILKENNENQVIILDDAYQHRKVIPRVNILLMDYRRPIYEDHLLPWGYLRESCKESVRANIVIVTKCPDDVKPIERRVMSKHINMLPSQAIYFTNLKYLEMQPVFEDSSMPNNPPNRDTQILLITGIANSKTLCEYVKKQYSDKITHLEFGDHHNYHKRDITHISKEFAKLSGSNKLIVTTEKDAMRLNEHDFPEEVRKNMFYLPIEVNFVFDDKENLLNLLLKYVTGNSGNYRLYTSTRQF